MSCEHPKMKHGIPHGYYMNIAKYTMYKTWIYYRGKSRIHHETPKEYYVNNSEYIMKHIINNNDNISIILSTHHKYYENSFIISYLRNKYFTPQDRVYKKKCYEIYNKEYKVKEK